MDQHHDPTRPDDQPTDRVAIPGDTPPAVWRLHRAEQPGCLSPQMARLLLDDLTQVGDVVLDVDDDVAFAATAARMGRRHHALGGAERLASMSHTAGYIDLILLHWPRPPVNPHWLLRACRLLLDTAGCVVIVVGEDGDQRVAHLNALSGAAATAGLRTVGHVAAIAPDAATLVAATDKPRGRRGRHRARPPAAARGVGGLIRPHTDLLIFEPEAAGDE